MSINCVRYSARGLVRAGEERQNAPPAVVPSTEEYQYADLGKEDGEIRLLHISGTAITLETYTLDNLPPYWALSYTWGQAEDTTGSSQDEKFSLSVVEYRR